MYKEMHKEEGGFWWHDGMRKINTTLLDFYLKNRQDNNILDAGCGTGGMLETLSHYGSVSGVDVFDDAIVYAKRKNIAQITKADVGSLPFNNAYFDLVTCFDVLYHGSVKSDTRAIEEFNRVLKSGGILLVREPAFDWLRGNIDKVMWTRHRYNKNELVKKLESHGFVVLRAFYANFFLFPLVILFRLFEKLFSKKASTEGLFAGNFLLDIIFRQFLYLEAWLLKYVNFPYGSSVICLAMKK